MVASDPFDPSPTPSPTPLLSLYLPRLSLFGVEEVAYNL
jgi:hypothetical protein